MNAVKRLGQSGVVPVVVIEDAKDAVPTARALAAGGIDVIEITLRTPAGLGAIEAVAKGCPEVLVGAGTVLTVAQAKAAVDAGAQFIVSPGFDRELVSWCVENGVAVTPGCVTPGEITAALAMGLEVLKFFPANIYGGLGAMKALAGPFGGVKFIPTGGISDKNLAEYMGVPYIHAVGGSWLCQKADIAAGDFGKITALSAAARQTALGYELAHVGINCESDAASMAVCESFGAAFGFATKQGASSNFASTGIEVMKSVYLGQNGHLAIRTANIGRAVADLAKKGFEVDMDTAKYKGDAMIAVYLRADFGGFAVHLLQK